MKVTGMRLVWVSDIHLNFADHDRLDRFLDEVLAAEPDGVVISGDIGEAPSVCDFLCLMDDAWQKPLYFVLGNHDFYFGSIRDTRLRVEQLCGDRERLHYLTNSDPVVLADGVAILGHDGWADARAGSYETSNVMLNDYRLVAELSGLSKEERLPVLRSLGDNGAAAIRERLSRALSSNSHVWIITHVPPLREACWHEGRISDEEWAPHFTCLAMGDTILSLMSERSDRQATVLCGHSHGEGTTQPLPNVKILTAGAEYGQPDIAGSFEIT